MKRFSVAVSAGGMLLMGVFAVALFSAPVVPPRIHPTGFQLAPAAKPERALLDTYCVTCHNERTKTAGVAGPRVIAR